MEREKVEIFVGYVTVVVVGVEVLVADLVDYNVVIGARASHCVEREGVVEEELWLGLRGGRHLAELSVLDAASLRGTDRERQLTNSRRTRGSEGQQNQ